MQAPALLRSPIRYDAARRRLWILGQRCHHGAVGALIAGVGGSWIAARGVISPGRATIAGARIAVQAVAVAGVGGAMMVHDRKDLAIWFERGPGSQI
jgi:hypothetical protein